MAFDSVEAIMRDVNWGWLLRYLHANGASLFFFAAYIHMFRGMYYGSYKEPREVLWILGVLILLLMIADRLHGLCPPLGPDVVLGGDRDHQPLLGDPAGRRERSPSGCGAASPSISATLNRFYSLHYLLPFMIAGVVALHIWALHVAGQNNPLGIDVKSKEDTVAFTPYATIKDTFATVLFLVLFAWLVFFLPNYLGHPDNYIPAELAQDARPHRAGVVFPAVLRDPSRHPEQAPRRHRLVLGDRGPVLPALARHVAGALGGLPPDLPAVLLDLRAGAASASAISARSRPRAATSSPRASSPPTTSCISW